MRRDELIGTTIANRFRVKRVLGEGGMATVYLAEQDNEPREVALKILRAELTSDKTFAKRFEREAKAAASVQHPNSVTILDAGVSGRWSYIAMELLQGDDLYALLERHRVLSPRTAATIVAEVCDALTVAHGLGIVHRDLKPENIMIVREASLTAEASGPKSVPLPTGSRVKVLDFGIAKLLDRQTQAPRPSGDRLDPPSAMTAVTRAGTLIGTPAYMSPEQCALLPVDTRSDIYTCGVLLFQMIAGRLPFEGPTALHIATKHIHEEPPTLRSLIPQADEGLDALVQKALSKRPTERQPSARNLSGALRRLIPTLPDVSYVMASGGAEVDSEDAPTGVSSVDGAAASEMIASAKTMVAEGVSGPPPSVLVRGGEAPPRKALMVLARHAPGPKGEEASAEKKPATQAEPEDLAATLIRPQSEGTGALTDDVARAPQPGAGPVRQTTMQSASAVGAGAGGGGAVGAGAVGAGAVGAGAPRIAVVGAAPTNPSSPPNRGPMPIPIGPVAPPAPMASVILAPSLSQPKNSYQGGRPPMPSDPMSPAGFVVAQPGQGAWPTPTQGSAAAPTFGLPPPAALSTAAPTNRRALWLGVLIGTLASAILFGVAYAFLLSR